MACLLLAAGLAMMAIGASLATIVLQLVLAILFAVVSLRVRDYP